MKTNDNEDRRREGMQTDATTAAEMAMQGTADVYSIMLAFLLSMYGPVLTTSEAAKVMKCHPSHVRAMCQDGRLKGARVGERWKISAAVLAAKLEEDQACAW